MKRISLKYVLSILAVLLVNIIVIVLLTQYVGAKVKVVNYVYGIGGRDVTVASLTSVYEDMMKITEELISHMAEVATGSTVVNYQGTEIDFTPTWRRMTMEECVKEYTGVDFSTINTEEEALAVAKEKGIGITPGMRRGEVINAFFEEFGEDKLIKPTFITHHPVDVSPLAKRNAEDPRKTDRFEAFANKWELANAFSELNDPIDQKERFMDQLRKKELGDDEACDMDEDFINALEVGLPTTGGLGIGIDRLIMFLTDSASIRDVILFPTMKPQN